MINNNVTLQTLARRPRHPNKFDMLMNFAWLDFVCIQSVDVSQMWSSLSSDVTVSCKVSLHLQPAWPQQNLAGRKKSHVVLFLLLLILNKRFVLFPETFSLVHLSWSNSLTRRRERVPVCFRGSSRWSRRCVRALSSSPLSSITSAAERSPIDSSTAATDERSAASWRRCVRSDISTVALSHSLQNRKNMTCCLFWQRLSFLFTLNNSINVNNTEN